MNSYLQLVCLLFSFFYGIFINSIIIFNRNIIDKIRVYFKIIITMLFIDNVSLLYIIIMYKLNNGVIHFYFYIMIVLGYVVACVKKRKDF